MNETNVSIIRKAGARDIHKLCTLGMTGKDLNQSIYGEDLVAGSIDFGLEEARNLSGSQKTFIGMDIINGVIHTIFSLLLKNEQIKFNRSLTR